MTNFNNKMHPRKQFQGNTCEHAKIRKGTVQSQNMGTANTFQNGQIQDRDRIKTRSDTT